VDWWPRAKPGSDIYSKPMQTKLTCHQHRKILQQLKARPTFAIDIRAYGLSPWQPADQALIKRTLPACLIRVATYDVTKGFSLTKAGVDALEKIVPPE
jgi:hypothetical protein